MSTIGSSIVSQGKGGRVWCDDLKVTVQELEEFIGKAREIAPDVEKGYRWYRIDHEAESMQEFDDSPMTLKEAMEVLDEKRNGVILPHRPEATTIHAIIDGENTIEELEAYLVLWKQFKATERS